MQLVVQTVLNHGWQTLALVAVSLHGGQYLWCCVCIWALLVSMLFCFRGDEGSCPQGVMLADCLMIQWYLFTY